MAAHPSRVAGLNSSTRDRRLVRSLADQHIRPLACQDRSLPALGEAPRRPGAEPASASPRESRKADGPPASQIPRAACGSTASLPARGSPSRSLSSDSERGPRSERAGPPPRQAPPAFAGRLGQPPRGPLSLHMYSRKNVFLQHSLHTAELQALAQHDG
ncbi:hypothetical protein COCON_G00151850 [Conger conger]|uniref:Uncharacterized protein n=1 Tax=Conger conger TaxID=82655 RepID=A0A9Q1D8F8_CONCO|nr:hypothetical protein COCON_G00151850 [Conger conger]